MCCTAASTLLNVQPSVSRVQVLISPLRRYSATSFSSQEPPCTTPTLANSTSRLMGIVAGVPLNSRIIKIRKNESLKSSTCRSTRRNLVTRVQSKKNKFTAPSGHLIYDSPLRAEKIRRITTNKQTNMYRPCTPQSSSLAFIIFIELLPVYPLGDADEPFYCQCSVS